MVIIISKNGENAKQIESSDFPNEDYLQRYVFQNPRCLPLNANFVSIEREFHTGAGSIDILAIDENEDIYVIETKLYKNPTRRDVLSQVLDYGIALSHDERFADSTIKYVILMDRLSEETKELINFVNKYCDFSVFAVEMKFYKTENEEIIKEITIPRLYGAEIEKRSEFTRTWDKQSFFAEAHNRLTDEQYRAVEALYNFSEGKADHIRFGRGKDGSFNVVVSRINDKHSIYSVYTSGKLTLHFEWLHNRKFQEELKQLLLEKGLFTFPANFDVFTKLDYNVPIEKWIDHREEFQNIITKLLDR